MVRQADLDQIRRRLDTLPMVQRAVFLLCRIDGIHPARPAL
jgi:DNA-directed RNA polymerase specialized sigma24 family protein